MFNRKSDRVHYEVTSLADDGSPGTLRYGLRRPEPLYVTFAVSGVIRLQSRLWVYRDYCTIDGESAPGPVILTGDTVYIRGNDVTLRFLTIAANRTDRALDSVWILLSTSVLVEYCTIFGGSDEILSATRSDNVRLYRNLIGNPLLRGHGFGTILSGTDDHSVNYCEENLFVNCTGRTPNVGIGNAVIAHNRVYNYGHMLSYTTNVNDAVVLQVGNLYRPGPQTVRDWIFMFPAKPSLVTLFVEKNELEGADPARSNRDLTKNPENGIFLEYAPGNGRFKIVPSKAVYLDSKERRRLYHRLDKLAKGLVLDKNKKRARPTAFDAIFDQVGNYKHRTVWDAAMLDAVTEGRAYTFPEAPVAL